MIMIIIVCKYVDGWMDIVMGTTWPWGASLCWLFCYYYSYYGCWRRRLLPAALFFSCSDVWMDGWMDNIWMWMDTERGVKLWPVWCGGLGWAIVSRVGEAVPCLWGGPPKAGSLWRLPPLPAPARSALCSCCAVPLCSVPFFFAFCPALLCGGWERGRGERGRPFFHRVSVVGWIVGEVGARGLPPRRRAPAMGPGGRTA